MRSAHFQIIALVILVTSPCLQATDVGGPILTDTTWGPAGNPHRVTSSTLVGNNATLTILPGTELRFQRGMALVVGSAAFGPGTLVCRGTAQSRVVMTSNVPFENPNQDPMPGDWSRVEFADQAVDAVFDRTTGEYVSGCILEYTLAEYAGDDTQGSGSFGIVVVRTSAPYVHGCEIRHSRYSGFTAFDTDRSIRLVGNEIHGCRYPVYFYGARATGCQIIGNYIHDNLSTVLQIGDAAGITDNVIENNREIFDGGVPIPSNSTFLRNTVRGNTGQQSVGIRISGNNIVVRDNLIEGNVSQGGPGGVAVVVATGLTFSGNTVINNVGGSGGVSVERGVNCTFSGNFIAGNVARSTGGGVNVNPGLFSGAPGVVTFVGNIIQSNHAPTGQAGGVYIGDNPNAAIAVSFAGNPTSGVHNVISCNDGYEMMLDASYRSDGTHDVNAGYVDWGTTNVAEIVAGIRDFFDDSTRAIVRFTPVVGFCPADLNSDNGVTIDDLLIYLEFYAAGHPRADVNAAAGSGCPDGGVTIDDLLYYLERYAAGC